MLVAYIIRTKMDKLVIIYFLICNLVQRYVAEEDVTFKNVSVCLPCNSSSSFADTLCFRIPPSSSLSQELNKYKPADTSCIEILHQHIPVIYKNALNNIHADSVVINFCNVAEIHPGFLQNSSLAFLDLTSNQLETIKRDLFEGALRVEILILSLNKIKHIESGAFDNISLKRVRLSSNELKDIPLGVFNNLSALVLDFNKIKSIPKGSFSNSTLAEIRLNGNQIETIEPGAFENTPNLVVINLAANKLTKISRGIFNEFSGSSQGLNFLGLGMNEIRYIETGAFENSSIKYVDLYSNKLTEIKNDTFRGSRIKILDLIHNRIGTTEDGALNIDGLEAIDLSANKLRFIKKDTFKKASITTVNLLDNHLKLIEPGSFGTGLRTLYIQESYLDDNSKSYIHSLRDTVLLSHGYDKLLIKKKEDLSYT